MDSAKYEVIPVRAGHATSAAIAGASERSIMNQTGHRSVQMVRRYIRDGNLFRENSAGKLGVAKISYIITPSLPIPRLYERLSDVIVFTLKRLDKGFCASLLLA